MYAASNSFGGTKLVLIGRDFNVWSPGHPTTKRFVTMWDQCRFPRLGHSVEEDRQPRCDGHKLDSHLLNGLLVPWAMREGPYVAPGRPPTALRSDHGPVVLGMPPPLAANERIMRLAYSHTQG